MGIKYARRTSGGKHNVLIKPVIADRTFFHTPTAFEIQGLIINLPSIKAVLILKSVTFCDFPSIS